jgi:hypothetical protein
MPGVSSAHQLDRDDEAIAAAAHGLNDRLTHGALSELLAQLPDRLAQGALAHGDVWPHRRAQLFARDDAIMMANQVAQHGKQQRRDGQRLPSPRQLRGSQVELHPCEAPHFLACQFRGVIGRAAWVRHM